MSFDPHFFNQLSEAAANSINAAATVLDVAAVEAVLQCAPEEVGNEAAAIAETLRETRERVASLYRIANQKQGSEL